LLNANTIACLLCCQAFIQRAGPEILVQDLPPKLEMVLQLAPTATQMHLLRSLLHVIGAHNSNVLRDTEVGTCSAGALCGWCGGAEGTSWVRAQVNVVPCQHIIITMLHAAAVVHACLPTNFHPHVAYPHKMLLLLCLPSLSPAAVPKDPGHARPW
jgi:hypothetical protein